MKNERIYQLADFFYSSDNSKNVPLRLAIITGQYSGADLTKGKFIKLLFILNNSAHLKEDLTKFLEDLEDEE